MVRRSAARSGMALILALAAIALGGGLALYLQSRAATLARTERAELLRERLRVAAAEAAREALWVLAADEDLAVDHLGEEWARPRETNRADGVSTWAVVEDAGRFVNWNNLAASNRPARDARDILLDLMMFCGDFDATVRIDALQDYVDADEEGTYEADFYRTGDAPQAPPNRALWAPSELLRVHGFTAELFRPRPRIDPDDPTGGDLSAATVLVPGPLSAPIPVNVNTAGRDVLMGVSGLRQEDAVRQILALRQVQPFESLAVMFTAYPEVAALLEGSVGVASAHFRVRARAAADGQHRTVVAWVERDPRTGDVRILQWLEGEG